MQPRPNWIDKVVCFLSPRAGNDRLRARLSAHHISKAMNRYYEGASNARRNDGWNPPGTNANSETKNSLAFLRNRSRDLVRNDPYAARSKSVIATNIVGAGIIPQPVSKASGKNKLYSQAWKDWAETTRCDYDGRHNFYGLQHLIALAIFESGECLIRRRKVSSNGSAVPIQLQVLEPDHLSSINEGPARNGGYVIQGVEFDSTGKRIAYWLYNQHPGGLFSGQFLQLLPERIPAEEVLHVYSIERAGQVRGVPWLAPAMTKIKDHSDFSDATLLRQKIAACFTAFVKDLDGIADATDNTKQPLGEKLEPGIIEVLRPGQDVTLANPPAAEGFEGFSRAQLRAIASGIGITYEALSSDYSQVNFSSGRMGWIEFQRNIDRWRWQMLIPQFCNPAWDWFTEAAIVSGLPMTAPTASWTPPRREMIDPAGEIKATVSAVRSGLTSLSEAIRENGYDPEDVLRQKKSDNDFIDSLGLVLDCDPRKVTQVGGIQMAGNQPADNSQNGDVNG